MAAKRCHKTERRVAEDAPNNRLEDICSPVATKLSLPYNGSEQLPDGDKTEGRVLPYGNETHPQPYKLSLTQYGGEQLPKANETEGRVTGDVPRSGL